MPFNQPQVIRDFGQQSPGVSQNFGATTDEKGQVNNGINPITGKPLGPNEGASISAGFNPTTGQIIPQPATPPPGAGIAGAVGSSNVTMPGGIDPRLAAVYQKAGMAPGGQGSGFADWQYWQNKMTQPGVDPNYFTDRLGKDLAGTGVDKPTGTPGQGAWQNSGQQPQQGVAGGGAIGKMMSGAGMASGMAGGQTLQPPAANGAAQAAQGGGQGPNYNDLITQLMNRVQQ